MGVFLCKNKLEKVLPIFNEILSSHSLSFPKKCQQLTKTLNRYKFFLFPSPVGGHPTGFDCCYRYTGNERDGSQNDSINHPFKLMIEDTVKTLPGPTEIARRITSLLKQKTTKKDEAADDLPGLPNDMEMEMVPHANIYDHPTVENMVSPTSISGAIGLIPGDTIDAFHATEGMSRLLNYDLFPGTTTGGYEDNQIPSLGDYDAESDDKTNVDKDVGGNIMLVEDICDEYHDHLAISATSSAGQAFHPLIDYHPN